MASFVFNARDLRAICRQMGVAVGFAGVSTYADDGTPVMGIFDRPVQMKLMEAGIGGVESALPELRLPFNAFTTMPQSGDEIAVGGVSFTVDQPTAEDDGAFLCYPLFRTTE